jgi:hypothetical protein
MTQADDNTENKPLTQVNPSWGEKPADHFGYASDEERRAKRGLEDWELVESIPDSQKGIPYWFLGVIVMVLLVALGLSIPFWGRRPGQEQDWYQWSMGIIGAVLYICVASGVVYFMVHLYGSPRGGKLDSDKSVEQADEEK